MSIEKVLLKTTLDCIGAGEDLPQLIVTEEMPVDSIVSKLITLKLLEWLVVPILNEEKGAKFTFVKHVYLPVNPAIFAAKTV